MDFFARYHNVRQKMCALFGTERAKNGKEWTSEPTIHTRTASITHSQCSRIPKIEDPKMVKIFVARHGQDHDNARGILNGHRDEPLTDLGRQQARDVGQKMVNAGFSMQPQTRSPSSSPSSPCSGKHVVISAIYSSPLKRAKETAEIFRDVLATSKTSSNSAITPDNNLMAVEVLNDLIERNFGVMTGMPTASIAERCGENRILVTEKIKYFLDPEGAETFPDLMERAKRLLVKIDEMHSTTFDESILLVTHGDFGKMIYAAYYNLEWENVLRQFHFGNSEVLLLSHDSRPDKAHVFETFQANA